MTKEEKRKWAHALVDKICDLNEQGEHYASIEFATDGDEDLYISVYAKEDSARRRNFAYVQGF